MVLTGWTERIDQIAIVILLSTAEQVASIAIGLDT
jgi:hypothetical protein